MYDALPRQKYKRKTATQNMQCRVQCWCAWPRTMLMCHTAHNVDVQCRAQCLMRNAAYIVDVPWCVQCWCAMSRTMSMWNAVHNVWCAIQRTMLMCNTEHNVDVPCCAQLWGYCTMYIHQSPLKNRNRKIWWLALNTFFGTICTYSVRRIITTHMCGVKDDGCICFKLWQ